MIVQELNKFKDVNWKVIDKEKCCKLFVANLKSKRWKKRDESQL